MDKALFTFMIGPVKGFVENGRKMRDLYAGSSILSKLINEATVFLKDHGNIVFPPATQLNTKNSNLPNRLVVDISNYTGNEDTYKELAQKLTCHVKKGFKKIYQDCLNTIQKVGEEEVDFRLANEQLDNFLEIYWLFVPYDDASESGYAEAYKEMIVKTAAIKGIRPFKQTKELWGRKCLLHPEYNGIFVKKNKDENYPSNTNYDHVIDLPNVGKFQFDIKENEALSAIAFVKRMYSGTNSRFISPRDIVLRETLALKTGVKDLFECKIEKNCILNDNKMKALGVNMTHLTDAIYDVWDGDFKYDPYDEDKPELEYPEEILTVAQDLCQELKSKEQYDELKNFKLQQYYAIIKFDGDSMGIKYSRLKDRTAHGQLSEEICKFASCARKIVENDGGICIYAGGEDVLAVLTLQNLWCTLKKLHTRFGEIGTKQIEGTNQTFVELVKKKNGSEDPFTFSAGIVIAHLKSPLKDVMRQVGEAEKEAKKAKKKNAFAISLMKRGSETRTIRYSFDNDYKQLLAFANLVDLFSVDQNSRSFVYNLSHLLLRLTKDSTKETNREMILSLIRQAVIQQRIKEEDEVLKSIKQLYKTVDTKSLMNTLDIIGFLSGRLVRAIEPIEKEVPNNDV